MTKKNLCISSHSSRTVRRLVSIPPSDNNDPYQWDNHFVIWLNSVAILTICKILRTSPILHTYVIVFSGMTTSLLKSSKATHLKDTK